MKTAEEWANELFADKHPHAMWEENIINFVKLVQLDAYKAGMTEAAEICEQQCSKTIFFSRASALNFTHRAILHARDNKT